MLRTLFLGAIRQRLGLMYSRRVRRRFDNFKVLGYAEIGGPFQPAG
jgi:hypothetical protein